MHASPTRPHLVVCRSPSSGEVSTYKRRHQVGQKPVSFVHLILFSSPSCLQLESGSKCHSSRSSRKSSTSSKPSSLTTTTSPRSISPPSLTRARAKAPTAAPPTATTELASNLHHRNTSTLPDHHLSSNTHHKATRPRKTPTPPLPQPNLLTAPLKATTPAHPKTNTAPRHRLCPTLQVHHPAHQAGARPGIKIPSAGTSPSTPRGARNGIRRTWAPWAGMGRLGMEARRDLLRVIEGWAMVGTTAKVSPVAIRRSRVGILITVVEVNRCMVQTGRRM